MITAHSLQSTTDMTLRLRAPLFLLACTAVGLASMTTGCSSAAETDAASDDSANAEALSTASYSSSTAVAYARAHWSNGVGECAEFVYDCLHAGGLGLAKTAWVPTLVSELASVRYEDHQGSGAVSASAGDVVVFSTKGGSAFCGPGPVEGVACGHTCLVVEGGSSAAAIKVDCHNAALSDAAVSYFLKEYPHYRVYHTASGSSGEGCYSATLGKDVDDNACVQTDSGDWYQCDSGSWVVRDTDPTACSSVTAY